MIIKKKNFVELEYTGKVKGENLVFDTTDEKLAKEVGMDVNPNMKFGPVIVCIGEGQLLKGLEDELEGKEAGKDYVVELSPDKAFGKKDASFIKMVPSSTFKKQQINPEPGMQINMDGMIGIIKTASGGRCMVDFNHPLSGRDLIYEVKINKIITDDKEKIKSYISLGLNMKDIEVEVKEGKAEIKVKKDVPKEIQDMLLDKLKELIPSVKEYSFKIEKK